MARVDRSGSDPAWRAVVPVRWTVVVVTAAVCLAVGFLLLQLGIYLGGGFADSVIGR